MITNFHLPRSTLLMLVSAFAGRERILRAYAEAVAARLPLLLVRRRDASYPLSCRVVSYMKYIGFDAEGGPEVLARGQEGDAPPPARR